MDNQDNDFDRIENAAADRRRQQDFNDLQNELSGNEVGRTARFLSPEARERLLAQRQGKPTKAMNALELALMSNPAYTAAYEGAADETWAAQSKVQSFQDEVEAAIAKTEADIARMVDNAATLPGGSKAFMDKDGVAWSVDGERIDEALAAGIDWAGKPSREDYELLIERQGQLEQYAHRGRVMANRLGENQNRLEDENEPPSIDELKAISEEAQDIGSELEGLTGELRELVRPDATPTLDATTVTPNMVPIL